METVKDKIKARVDFLLNTAEYKEKLLDLLDKERGRLIQSPFTYFENLRNRFNLDSEEGRLEYVNILMLHVSSERSMYEKALINNTTRDTVEFQVWRLEEAYKHTLDSIAPHVRRIIMTWVINPEEFEYAFSAFSDEELGYSETSVRHTWFLE